MKKFVKFTNRNLLGLIQNMRRMTPVLAKHLSATVIAAASITVMAWTATSAGAATLFGRVSHSELLPPLDKQCLTVPLQGRVNQSDASQDDRSLHSIAPRAEGAHQQAQPEKTANFAPERQTPERVILWVPIPRWLAGKWSKQGDLTVSHTDLRTGVTTPVNQWTQNLQTTTWGNQIDGHGNVWHGYSMPTEIVGQSNGKVVKFIIISGRVEPSSPDHLITRLHSIVIESYGRQVVDEFQQEALNDLYLLQSGELQNYSSSRDFTNQGLPIREGMLDSRFTKVGAFEPVESQDGVDLLKSLNDYLKTHNMSQLVRPGRISN